MVRLTVSAKAPRLCCPTSQRSADSVGENMDSPQGGRGGVVRLRWPGRVGLVEAKSAPAHPPLDRHRVKQRHCLAHLRLAPPTPLSRIVPPVAAPSRPTPPWPRSGLAPKRARLCCLLFFQGVRGVWGPKENTPNSPEKQRAGGAFKKQKEKDQWKLKTTAL